MLQLCGGGGAFCLHRIEGDYAHFDMLTFWDDVESIRRFAGEAYELAYYYDFDDEFLLEKERCVSHFKLYGANEYTAPQATWLEVQRGTP